jgi:hypothetical protein
MRRSRVPSDFPVRPLRPTDKAADRATCGHCGLSWDDAIPTSYTPAPSARCPFEAFHTYKADKPTLRKADVDRLPDPAGATYDKHSDTWIDIYSLPDGSDLYVPRGFGSEFDTLAAALAYLHKN